MLKTNNGIRFKIKMIKADVYYTKHSIRRLLEPNRNKTDIGICSSNEEGMVAIQASLFYVQRYLIKF